MNSAPAADAWKELCGTILGSYDYAFEGKGAWVGHAILAIEGQPPLQATFVDRNTSIARKREGEICGTETITLETAGGDSFEVCGKFTGSPASTPGLLPTAPAPSTISPDKSSSKARSCLPIPP